MLNRKTDVNHMLFLGAYLLCMIDALMMTLSTFGELRRADTISLGLRGVAAVFILIKLMLDSKYTFASLMYIFLAGVVLLVTFLRSAYNHIFYLMLIVLGARNIDIPSVIRVDVVVRIVIMMVIILSSLLGVIENYVTYRTGTQEFRYSLGFNHPNTLASLVFLLTMEEAWIRKRSFSFTYTLLMWALAGLIYVVTLNRTAVMLIAVFPLLLLMTANRRHRTTVSTFSCVCLQAVFPIAVIISLLTMFLSENSSIFGLLDNLMSRRFTNCAVLFRRYGIPLLGQRVTLISMKTARQMQSSIALLDVAYLRTLIQAGPLVLLLMALMHFRAVKDACVRNERHTLLILCALAAFGVSESGYNNVYMNFSLLFGAAAMFTPLASQEIRILDA